MNNSFSGIIAEAHKSMSVVGIKARLDKWLGRAVYKHDFPQFEPTGVYETDLSQLITQNLLPRDSYFGVVKYEVVKSGQVKIHFGFVAKQDYDPIDLPEDSVVAPIGYALMPAWKARDWANGLLAVLGEKPKTMPNFVKRHRKIIAKIWLGLLLGVSNIVAFTHSWAQPTVFNITAALADFVLVSLVTVWALHTAVFEKD